MRRTPIAHERPFCKLLARLSLARTPTRRRARARECQRFGSQMSLRVPAPQTASRSLRAAARQLTCLCYGSDLTLRTGSRAKTHRSVTGAGRSGDLSNFRSEANRLTIMSPNRQRANYKHERNEQQGKWAAAAATRHAQLSKRLKSRTIVKASNGTSCRMIAWLSEGRPINWPFSPEENGPQSSRSYESKRAESRADNLRFFEILD